MSQNKVLKIYSQLTLEDKERLLNMLLGDSYIYCHSDKRHMGFEFEADDMFACTNGTRLQINLELDKKATLLELNFKIKGAVNVNCDLTNEPYNQNIENEFDLVVKFGDEYNDEDTDILIVPHGTYEINIQQYIYELIVLAVPIKRIHPGVEDGTLDSDILKKLEELSPKLKEEKDIEEEIDPRWNTLKKLLTDK